MSSPVFVDRLQDSDLHRYLSHIVHSSLRPNLVEGPCVLVRPFSST